jgi:hypothetical protein
MSQHDVRVRLDARWIEIPLDGTDPRRWARRAVADGLAVRQRTEKPAVVAVLEQAYADLATNAREHASSASGELVAAFVLAPRTDMTPVTVAKLDTAVCLPGTTLERAAEESVLPAEARFGDPVVSDVETSNGPSIRVVQLAVVPMPAPDGGVEQQVHTMVVYVWLGAEPGTLLLLHAWYPSSVEAELAAETLEELARSVEVSAVS